MSRNVVRYISNYPAPDEKKISVIAKDKSGGINTRQDASDIKSEQSETLKNANIEVGGRITVRPGYDIYASIASLAGNAIFGYQPSDGTNKMIAALDPTRPQLFKIALGGTGTASLLTTLVSVANELTSPANMFQVFKSGNDRDVTIYADGEGNIVEIGGDDSITKYALASTSNPPDTQVNAFYQSRWWALKDNKLYWSSALPTDYETAFSPTNAYNAPVGEEMALVGTRSKGLIALGKDKVWWFQPSNTPAATDSNGLLVDQGCVAPRTAQVVGEDVFYLAKDGVRGVFATQYDTLKYRASYPLTFFLRDTFDNVNWAYIHKATAVYFDNKYLLALPTDSSTYNNTVLVYFPLTEAWVEVNGWEVADWTTCEINGSDRLFYTDAQNGQVIEAWSGSDDNGTDIDYEETGKRDDLGYPLKEKSGGEFLLRAKATGEYTVNIFVSVDEGEFSKLGELTTEERRINLVTGVTFPVEFLGSGTYTQRYHLDGYGEWYRIQFKLTSSGSFGGDLKIIERSIITFVNEYQEEAT